MYPLLFFLSVNLFLYSWIGAFHSVVHFNKFEYLTSANHYLQDPRINGGNFSLINSLGQYDSQWYLKIADKGYPDHPKGPIKEQRKIMHTLLYNFFPLYPLCIAVINFFIRNVQLSAFILSNSILLACVYSLYFVVSRWFTKKIALKTILLILLFPFGIFLRGYYSEGLRLLLFIWFCYGLAQKKHMLSAISVGLLCVTSGISLLLLPFYFGVVWFYRKSLSLQKMLVYGLLAIIPFLLWMSFCYIHTGDFLIFIKTRYAWERPHIFPLFYNIFLLFIFPRLPFRDFYSSQIDVLSILVTVCIAFLSKNVLSKVVWLAAIILAFSPLLVQDSVSFARFSSVFFPFFVYLAVVLRKQYYILLVYFFCAGLLVSSLYFVNWYWIE